MTLGQRVELELTMEEISALRVILEFEATQKTGDLLKSDADPVEELAGVTRNMKLFRVLDFVLHYPVQCLLDSDVQEVGLEHSLKVAMDENSFATFKDILEEGSYLRSLKAADTNEVLNAMIPMVVIRRNIESLKEKFHAETKEKSPEPIFFPMKMPTGKPN